MNFNKFQRYIVMGLTTNHNNMSTYKSGPMPNGLVLESISIYGHFKVIMLANWQCKNVRLWHIYNYQN